MRTIPCAILLKIWYLKAVVSKALPIHSDDWGRTIYIDTLGVNTVDFDISATKKKALVESGRKGGSEFL